MQPHFYNVVNDELRDSKETHRGVDPRTEEELWPCPVATTQDFEDAVAAAQKAFATWSQTTVAERQALLVKLADVIKENADELVSILMKETGKSVCRDQDIGHRVFGHSTNTPGRKSPPTLTSKPASPNASTTVRPSSAESFS